MIFGDKGDLSLHVILVITCRTVNALPPRGSKYPVDSRPPYTKTKKYCVDRDDIVVTLTR